MNASRQLGIVMTITEGVWNPEYIFQKKNLRVLNGERKKAPGRREIQLIIEKVPGKTSSWENCIVVREGNPQKACN